MRTVEEKIVILFSKGLSCLEISALLKISLSKVEEVIDEVEVAHYQKYGSIQGVA